MVVFLSWRAWMIGPAGWECIALLAESSVRAGTDRHPEAAQPVWIHGPFNV
jgi:hypothetical protein